MKIKGFTLRIDRSLLVLVSLASGPKHGYALISDIEATSGVRLGAGTLYGVLNKLESDGLISSLPAEERRLPYELTQMGRVELREILATMARLSAEGLARLSVVH